MCSRLHLAPPKAEDKFDLSHLSFVRRFAQLANLPVWQQNGELSVAQDQQGNLFEKIANGAVIYNETSSILVKEVETINSKEELQRGRIAEGPLVLPLAESSVQICYEALLPHDYVLEGVNRTRSAEISLLRMAGWGVVEIPFSEWRKSLTEEKAKLVIHRRKQEFDRLSG